VWGKLKAREKWAIVIFALAVFFGVYMKFVQEPLSKKVAEYKSQIQRAQAQLRDLETKKPQDTELRVKIKDLEEDDAKLSESVKELEGMVPSRLYASQLVSELTRLAKEVKLESIKQWITKEQAYSRIFLEVKFYSSYPDAVSYLASVESVSPFIHVEELEILEPAGKTVELGGAPVKLVVSCLLTDSASGAALRALAVPHLNIKRDILVSSSRPVAALSDSKFILEGITFDPRNSSAIINGDVYLVNSEIGGYKVKKILEDSVVLNDGVEDHILSLKTTAEKRK
jgi:Tfp pilus assembly protein PilO